MMQFAPVRRRPIPPLGGATGAPRPARDAAARAGTLSTLQRPLIQRAIVWLVIAAITYNTVLAFLNAQVMAVTPAHVMTAEAMLLVGAAGLIVYTGVGDDDLPSISIAIIFAVLAIVVSMMNGAVFPDAVRHVAIIALFSLLGLRADFQTLLRVAAISSLLVLAILAVEAFALTSYVAWFQPAQYYEATRGLEDPSYNDTGLFANALSFEDRFSFDILGHRASSLFLEQVSLANYSAVLLVMLITFWKRMPPAARLLLIVTVVAILLTTDSRTGLILALAAMGGYFLFPRLPAYMNIAIAPLLLLLALAVMAGPEARLQDDVVGRLTLTMRTMSELDLAALLGLRAFEASEFADSGYTYVLYSSTVFGLLVLWTFVSLFIPQARPEQKRCAYLMGLFFGSSLLVAGTSIFTIKVASLLWLIAGVARRWPFEEPEAVTIENGSSRRAVPPRGTLNRRPQDICA